MATISSSSSRPTFSSSSLPAKRLSLAAQDVVFALLSRFDQNGSWDFKTLNLFQEQTGDEERLNSQEEFVALFKQHNIPLTKEQTLDCGSLIKLYELHGEDALKRDMEALLSSKFSLGSSLQQKLQHFLHPNESQIAWKGEFSMKRDLTQIEIDENLSLKAANEKARTKGWVGVFDLTEKGRGNVDEQATEEDKPPTKSPDNKDAEEQERPSSTNSLNTLCSTRPPTLVQTPPVTLVEKPSPILATIRENTKLNSIVGIETGQEAGLSSKLLNEERLMRTTVEAQVTNLSSLVKEGKVAEEERDSLREGGLPAPPRTPSRGEDENVLPQPQNTRMEDEKAYSLPRPPTPPLRSEQENSSTSLMPLPIVSTRSATYSPKHSSPVVSVNERRLQTVKLALASAPLGIPRAGSLPQAGLSWLSEADVEAVIADFDIVPSVYVLSESEAGARDWLESKAGLSALHAEEARIIREQVELGIVATATELFSISNTSPAGIPNQTVKNQAFNSLFASKTSELSLRLTSDPVAACDLFWEYVKDFRSNKWPPLVPLSLPYEKDESCPSLPDSPGSATYPQGFESWLRWRETRRRISVRAFKSWAKGKESERTIASTPRDSINSIKLNGEKKTMTLVAADDKGVKVCESMFSSSYATLTADLNPQVKTETTSNPIVNVDIRRNDSVVKDPVRRLSLSSAQVADFNPERENVEITNVYSTSSPKRSKIVEEDDDDTLSDTEVLVNAVVEVASVLARRLAKERARKSAEKAKFLHPTLSKETKEETKRVNTFEDNTAAKNSQQNLKTLIDFIPLTLKEEAEESPNETATIIDNAFVRKTVENSVIESPTRSAFHAPPSVIRAPIESPQSLLDTSLLPPNSLNHALRASPILQSIAAALGGYLHEARSELDIKEEAKKVVDKSLASLEEKARRQQLEVEVNSSISTADRASAFFELAEKTFSAQLSVLADPQSPSSELLNQTKKLVKVLKEFK